ncbi:MAG TPA: RedB protein [Verrucomicrobiae bacterium]|jgi:hypothetical protein
MKPILIKQRRVSPVITLLWLGVTVGGTIAMMCYSLKPGLTGTPPSEWPAASKVVPSADGPTLLMFVHPKCPCSDASVGELALLMAHCKGHVKVHVFFVKPPGQTTNWVLTSMWRKASQIPGVAVARDDDGREARLFGAATSGGVALFDVHGQLRFHGGITAGRGHSGDNSGRDAIQALILDGTSAVTQTPVFGCDLFECRANGQKGPP